MRKTSWIVGVALLVPGLSSAQVGDDLRQQGYLFAAPGSLLYEGGIPTLELGGGMQWLVYRGLGLGFDASAMGFTECFGCLGMLLASMDASYHFVPDSGRFVPFVLGGIGGAWVGDGQAALVNVGGGFNYWFENGMALRLEVRDRFESSSGVHLVGVRVGVTF